MSAPGARHKAPRSFLGKQMTARLLDWSRKVLLGCLVPGTCRSRFDTTAACPPDSCFLPLPLSVASLVLWYLTPQRGSTCKLLTSLFPGILSSVDSDLQGHTCCFREKILPGSPPILLEQCPSAEPFPHRDQDKAWDMGIKNELLTQD